MEQGQTNLLFGLSGSVASYSGYYLSDIWKNQGLNVKVIFSKHAKGFMELIENKCQSEIIEEPYDLQQQYELSEQLVQWADIFLIAPLTANTLAKLAIGLTDNLISRCFYNFSTLNKPIIIAPCMNHYMWNNKVTEWHLDLLKTRLKENILIQYPTRGIQANGEVGDGNMCDIFTIVKVLNSLKKMNN